MADNKYDLIKSGFDRIIDGIIHNNLTARSNRGKLLDPAAKTTSNSCCHDDKRCLFHVTVLLYLLIFLAFIWRYHNTNAAGFQSN